MTLTPTREKDMKRNDNDTANDEVTFEGERPTTTNKTEPTHAELEKEEEMKEALEAYRMAGAVSTPPPPSWYLRGGIQVAEPPMFLSPISPSNFSTTTSFMYASIRNAAPTDGKVVLQSDSATEPDEAPDNR